MSVRELVNGEVDNVRVASSYVEREVVNSERDNVRVEFSNVEREVVNEGDNVK